MYRYIENDKVAGQLCSIWRPSFQLDAQSKRPLPLPTSPCGAAKLRQKAQQRRLHKLSLPQGSARFEIPPFVKQK